MNISAIAAGIARSFVARTHVDGTSRHGPLAADLRGPLHVGCGLNSRPLKSVANKPSAWLPRNVFHDGSARTGGGGRRRESARIRRIVPIPTRRPPRTVRVDPLLHHQTPVPTQHRRGSNQAVEAQLARQQADQRRKDRPIRPGQARRLHLAPSPRESSASAPKTRTSAR
jgi:hypothetical protein